MALSAGVLHFAQVQVHADEDPSFGAFFFVVGLAQVVGGLYLYRPRGPLGVRTVIAAVGIWGSLGTMAIWALSRTLGLPFGSEPGYPEEVGLADAAAFIFESFTALLLIVWLRHLGRGTVRWAQWAIVGTVMAIGLAVVWLVLRALEVFDPDPRLVSQPELTDGAAIGFLLLLSAFFAGLAVERRAARLVGIATLAGLSVLELSLVAFTVPARGGQNSECRYAPIAEDSGIAHARPPQPIEMQIGETRSVVALLLVACADAPIELIEIIPLRIAGGAVELGQVTMDRSRTSRADRVRDRGSAQATEVAGTRLVPGAGRYAVVVQARAVGPGRVDTSALRIDYRFKGEPASFAFASFTAFCVGKDACALRR